MNALQKQIFREIFNLLINYRKIHEDIIQIHKEEDIRHDKQVENSLDSHNVIGKMCHYFP
jgi:hypothetical protein